MNVSPLASAPLPGITTIAGRKVYPLPDTELNRETRNIANYLGILEEVHGTPVWAVWNPARLPSGASFTEAQTNEERLGFLDQYIATLFKKPETTGAETEKERSWLLYQVLEDLRLCAKAQEPRPPCLTPESLSGLIKAIDACQKEDPFDLLEVKTLEAFTHRVEQRHKTQQTSNGAPQRTLSTRRRIWSPQRHR